MQMKSQRLGPKIVYKVESSGDLYEQLQIH